VLAVLVSAVWSARWLGSNARQEVPVSLALEFVHLLHAKQFSEALALAEKSPYVGSSASELERIAGRQLCSSAERLVGTSPVQTNGNRVRRWLSQSQIEMSELHVELEGDCLLRVTLRHSPGTGWHVYSIASHAG
jgi:hypothetical protein